MLHHVIIFVHCWFYMHACLTVGLGNWSFIGAFPFIVETTRTEQLIPHADGHFRWWYPTRLRRNFLCNAITDFNSWHHSKNLDFPAFRTPFSTTLMMAPLTARLVNSGNTTSKHHITYLDTFSCSYLSVSKQNYVKISKFYVFTL